MGLMRREIENSIDRVAWQILSPQVGKDIFILVSQDLDLVEAAISVVEDQKERVQNLIEQDMISKPTLEQIQAWDRNPEKQFQAVIAHPFVLIQEAYDH